MVILHHKHNEIYIIVIDPMLLQDMWGKGHGNTAYWGLVERYLT